MAIIDLVMPKMGESIMEATILKWHKKPGDNVKMDETLLEIATDKVDTEVPSTAEGVVQEILYKENEVVPIGKVIARIQSEVEESHEHERGNEEPGNEQKETFNKEQGASDEEYEKESNLAQAGFRRSPTERRQESKEMRQEQSREFIHSTSGQEQQNTNSNGRFFSPLVLTIAANEGVSMAELENIPGTGNEGRVTKKDILQYVNERKSSRHQSKATSQPEVTVIRQPGQLVVQNAQPGIYSGNVEIIEMDRMRKLIADHMVRSKHTSPHVTSFSEADVTNLVMWREKVKNGFEKREGIKLTFTPLFIEAVVRCIKKFPLVNSSVDGTNIIVKKDINIGMATALPGGSLIVPVIKNADQLNLVGLAKRVNSMAENARNNKLKPDDTQDGTFTLTNVGTFGSLMGTPIINQPQVAILAVGAIKKRPVVLETALGDSIAIRHMMYLSLSYDHRIVDGSLGATFLTAVAKELENFNSDREY